MASTLLRIHSKPALLEHEDPQFFDCNICGRRTKKRSRFDRFCGRCKHESEVFSYADWLPEPVDFLRQIMESQRRAA